MIHEATTAIEAAPEAVWRVLVQARSYAEWDNGLDQVAGTIAVGERLRLYYEGLHPNVGRVESVLTVRELVPNQRMVWSASIPVLARNEQVFLLEKHFETTRFTMREEHGGLFFGLLNKRGGGLDSNVERFAQGLKARVESLEPS